MPGGMDADDLMQVAFISMLDAVKKWDEGRGAFLTFYGLSLKGGLTIAAGRRTKRERLDPLQDCLSLDAPLPGGDDGEDILFSDIIPDPAAEAAVAAVEDRDEKRDLRETIHAALSKLTTRERDAIQARYWYGLTVEQTAWRMRMSKSGAYKAEQSALRRLRHPAVSKALLPWAGA